MLPFRELIQKDRTGRHLIKVPKEEQSVIQKTKNRKTPLPCLPPEGKKQKKKRPGTNLSLQHRSKEIIIHEQNLNVHPRPIGRGIITSKQINPGIQRKEMIKKALNETITRRDQAVALSLLLQEVLPPGLMIIPQEVRPPDQVVALNPPPREVPQDQAAVLSHPVLPEVQEEVCNQDHPGVHPGVVCNPAVRPVHHRVLLPRAGPVVRPGVEAGIN